MEATSSSTTWNIATSAGLVFDAKAGERPQTPKDLIATRAVQCKGGWLGQIVMSGEIVFETIAKESSADALEEVNRRIHESFRRLIVGA